jgi:hypothetical protein
VFSDSKQIELKPPSRWPVVVGILVAILLGAGLLLPIPLTQQNPFFLFFVLQLPYAVTLLMLLRPRADRRWIQLCMTVAAVLGIGYTIFIAVSSVAVAIGIGFGGSRLQAFSLLGLVPVNLFVTFAAAAARKGSSSRDVGFSVLKTIGAVALIVVGLLGYGYLNRRDQANRVQSRLDQEQAIERIHNILACLESYQRANAVRGLPQSLAETAAVPECRSVASGLLSVAGYSFRYEPAQSPGADQVGSFRLEARPAGFSFHDSSPYVADGSGIIYGQTPIGVRPMSSGGAYVLFRIRGCVHDVADKNTTGDVESLLTGVRDRCYRPDTGEPIGTWEKLDGKLVFRTICKDCTVEMQVATGIIGSARCTSYGVRCLRSYFMDELGAIHGTPEPRPATIDDPVVPVCESSYAPCDPALLQ